MLRSIRLMPAYLLTAVMGAGMSYAATAAPLPPTLQLPPAIPAPPAAADFKTYGAGLPLAEFLRTTIGDILHKPYVLTPAVAVDVTPISADLSHVKPQDILPIVKDILDAAGYGLREVRSVYVIDKKPPPEKVEARDSGKILIYRPKHRSVSDLSTYFSLFPKLQFAYGAGLARPSLSPALVGGPNANSSNGQPSAPSMSADFSSGATTYNQTTGDPSLLVIKGEQERLDEFASFMEQVDKEVHEVVVRAFVFEVRSTQSNQSGVSLTASILNNHLKLNAGGTPSNGDSLQLSLGSTSISAVLGALASDSRVHLVSSPVLRAADASSASATIGTDTPTLGAVTTSNGAATQSIQYQSAGVILNVAPRVFEQSVRLKISQEVSSFVTTETGLSATPTKLRRAFVSDVVAHAGDVILLGGLSSAQTSSGKSRGLFGLGTNTGGTDTDDVVVMLAIERI